MEPRDFLRQRAPTKTHLVAIDSDGCVFDSMGVKQRKFFIPQIIRFWKLEPIASTVTEVVEFLYLFSRWRGRNRFDNLLLAFEFLADHEDVKASGVELPDLDGLRAYLNSGRPLGNASIIEYVEETRDPEVARVRDWSLTVSELIHKDLPPIPLFENVSSCLERIGHASDAIVVSQTPTETVEQEWSANGILEAVLTVSGQEQGSKSEVLAIATAGKYPPERVLMIGDSLGDQAAAHAIGACFYPIIPGMEHDSWAQLQTEGLDRFFAGTFQGTYQEDRNAAFLACLPDTPPWLA